MYCSNCGALLPDGAKFCQSCGTQVALVSKDEGNAGQFPTFEIESVTQDKSKYQKKKSNITVAAIAVVCV